MIVRVEPNKDVVRLLNHVISEHDESQHSPHNHTWEQFQSQTIPESNRDRGLDPGNGYTYLGVDKFTAAAGKILGAYEQTNGVYYHANRIMEWHTNSNNSGTRTYYCFSRGDSVFRWKDPDTGEIHDDWDDIDRWTVRQFKIDPKKPLWHTIWSGKGRYAFGFNTP